MSTEAAACPHCGIANPASAERVVVVEQTAKKWKAYQLWGVGLCIVGFGAAAAQHGEIGVILLLLGILTFIYSRFGAWWHHG